MPFVVQRPNLGRMMLRIVVFAAALLLAGAAEAQAPSPSADDSGAAPAADAPQAAKPAKHKKAPKAEDASSDDKDAGGEASAKGVASIIGKPLKRNGFAGWMEIIKGDDKDKPLKIVNLKLSGEVISNSKQKCEISIVADGPIALSREGSPDGLPRFAADVPACPISFDLVDGGVIVPPQTQACVFKAADCQASPSGVWGPDTATLADQYHGMAEAGRELAKERSKAEASIAESLKTLGKRSKGEDEELTKEQGDFNAQRDETCVAYIGESQFGFCDARMTQARAALLRKQVAKAPPAKEKETAKKKKKKSDD